MVNDHDPASEWDQPPATAADPARRAAIFVWCVGALEVATFGCCAAMSGFYSLVPIETLERLMDEAGQQLPREVLGAFIYVFIGALTLGVVPGLALLGLGFAVQRRRRGPTLAALVITLAQSFIVAIMLLLALIGSATAGNPAALTINVLVLGSPLVVLAMTVRWLWLALHEAKLDGASG